MRSALALLALTPLLMAAEYHLFAEGKPPQNLTQRDRVQLAHDYLGLSDFNPFEIDQKVIEYAIA